MNKYTYIYEEQLFKLDRRCLTCLLFRTDPRRSSAIIPQPFVVLVHETISILIR